MSRAEIRIGAYRLGERIGGGSFGDLYAGYHTVTGAQVAIKLEHVSAQYPQLAWEYRMYTLLEGQPGFPTIHGYATEGEYTVLIMERLGASLESMRLDRVLTLSRMKHVATQVITRLEQIHAVGVLHRDLKPENFLEGPEGAICCIDFGLAKKYLRDGVHIPPRTGLSLIGTARYASINNHLGCEQSRRDDLESAGYMLVYLVKGHLPWQGIKSRARYREIGVLKARTPVDELCRGLPAGFARFLTAVRALRFEERPDYAALRALFA